MARNGKVRQIKRVRNEVLVALKMKGGVDRYDLTAIPFLSEIVQEHSGIRMMATKPIVGRNVFSHESGIHIAAILEDPETYEYILPESVGRHRTFILGKHTGRRGLEHILQKTGIELTPGQIGWVLNRVKEISEGKCAVTQDVLLRVIDKAREEPDVFRHSQPTAYPSACWRNGRPGRPVVL